VAALLGTLAAVSIWYLVLVVEIGPLYGWGAMPTDLWKSFAVALLYSSAAVSVVFLISSLLKRSMSATIVGVLALLMILPILQMILTLLDHEPWFILTYSANLITSVLGGSSTLMRHGGDFNQYTPTLGTGIVVIIAYAVVAFVIGLVLANRKSAE
jgi:ABC-type transport system involved in multi-copper enzyme maturation permease subunit